MLLAINRYDLGNERFPMYDNIGSAVGLVCELGTVTDSYALDTFGSPSGPAQGSTPNPYRYGAAWGYITDPSGLLQLGARFYWPEVGRFVSQDPAQDEVNWYAYAEDDPVSGTDPEGLKRKPPCDHARAVAAYAHYRNLMAKCRRDNPIVVTRLVLINGAWSVVAGTVMSAEGKGLLATAWGAARKTVITWLGTYTILVFWQTSALRRCQYDALVELDATLAAANCPISGFGAPPPWWQ